MWPRSGDIIRGRRGEVSGFVRDFRATARRSEQGRCLRAVWRRCRALAKLTGCDWRSDALAVHQKCWIAISLELAHDARVLRVSKIHKSFGGAFVLDGVDFSIRSGTITCLLGGNGSGKTTLFNIICGFLRAEAGSVWLGEREITGRAPFSISSLGIARTFQDLRLIGKLTVRENVLLALPRHPGEQLRCALLPPGFQRERDAADRRRSDSLLAEFFLAEVPDQLASEISYGQQKLLTLACCAAMDASLLLLDEPVAGISPEYREHIAERLASLKAAGKTILLIEHQPDFLERTGDAFLYLQAGRLHRFDTLAALRAAPVAHDALN